MEEALELSRAKDTKERMAGVERLHQLLEASRKSLSSSEVTSLVDTCMDLLKDNNFRVSQGALQALASAAVLSGDHFKLHFNALLPAVVDRLGDAKQPVRDAARRLLLTLMEVSSPTIIVERAGSFAWAHKSWRVREEFTRTVTAAINLFASTELPLQRAILPPVLHLLNDPNPAVREAAILCIEEMYTQAGPQFRDELHRHNLPSSLVKDINARLEGIQPKVRSTDGIPGGYITGEIKHLSVNPKKSSPKAKSSSRETSLFGGEGDITEKPIDPVKVYSDKELTREIEKIASTLVPEKDWSIRIAAMQRVEGLVIGGATDYPCFRGLLKQLVGPLNTQLSDRRSSIVKQACHLLCFLSKDLLGDFEACAEMFIPVSWPSYVGFITILMILKLLILDLITQVLFKLVVITVLVIAESADNCIKTMLRNCKVSRVLPRIADCAKNDRNAVLRARCCEYALLVLEHWPDAPEIHRSADLYEDMIKCCVSDAMSEVRSTARMCYRMFAKTWPERSRRLFASFDHAIQRLINEEDGGIHRRHASPSIRDRGALTSLASQTSAPSNLPGYGTSAIVAMDRSSSISSGTSISSGILLSQAKSLGKGTERSLESMLHASKQKVSAIESMLRGLDLSDKHNSSFRSSSLDLGVDPPSSRDPPFPAAVSATNHLTSSLTTESTTSGINKGSNRNGGLGLSDIITQIQASKDSAKLSYHSNVGIEPLSSISSYSSKRASDRLQERSSLDDNSDIRETRRFIKSNHDKQYLDAPYRDGNFRESHNSYVPNFQRPLLRKNVAGRMSAGRRRSFDDNQLSLGEMPNYAEGPSSLHEALSEGLSSGSDWSARVAAFNYLHSLLQQGPKGVIEVVQNFEKVMKLFFQHLDDPHHKVAQAALSTLADIVPACRKPFEGYMERILPHVFSRLIDPKELVRQPCSTTLEVVSKTYSIDSLLPALLRSLDEQRSPKAKLAVIEFAINSFNKHAMNPEGAANIGILKLWLAKLTPLVHDKNTKLKEAAITCIISVYSHFDSIAVLNFILSLSVEEQNSLRRALKQYTPRIEVDLINYLQNKKERQRSKSSYDSSDVVGTSSEDGYVGYSRKAHYLGRYSAGSLDGDGGRKWSSQDSTLVKASLGQTSSGETQEHLYQNFETDPNSGSLTSKTKDLAYAVNPMGQNFTSQSSQHRNVDSSINLEGLSTPRLDVNGLMLSEHLNVAEGYVNDKEHSSELALNHHTAEDVKINSITETGPSIPQILHMVCSGGDGSPVSSKRTALQQLVDASISNDHSIWTKYFNQILTVVLEVLDDSDSSVKELALSLIVEMLKNQKGDMENSVEIVIEKLLHVTKDIIPKVSNEAEHCLTIVLSQYDPFRCLSVIVPLLVTEDEKTLVICINCLTKLVGRLSQEELMAQLPSFLPALFEAFGNQSADVRKTVVFCLVDIYIMLGKAFLPYLQGLNSTQLKLVTIYANRISQARTGKTIDAVQD
ncbi:CLIP-associated protein isoform X1 [Vigna radiata var. radiata]|uniref:CLIP-associated protein isoform X1 n=1 Tax=Vigna radiata var. radiata TaxID=3916 RepID=A0A1S3TPX0_VIGRR|nr:CLIP-associated protein isoform X1 [Vigna radiata var. radiata]